MPESQKSTYRFPLDPSLNMNPKEGSEHDQLRQKTPTKIINPVRTIFPTAMDTLNHSSGIKFRPIHSIDWDNAPVTPINSIQPKTKAFGVEEIVYKGWRISNLTEVKSLKLTIEEASKCYRIYVRQDLDDSNFTFTLYFDEIRGVMINGPLRNRFTVDFALKTDISQNFQKMNQSLSLTENNEILACKILRVTVISNVSDLNRFKNELTSYLSRVESKCVIKLNTSSLGPIENLEKELNDEQSLKSDDAVRAFNLYSRHLSSPKNMYDRSYSHSNRSYGSPDNVFDNHMKPKKSKLAKPLEVDLSASDEPLKSSPSPSYNVRRSNRLIGKSLVTPMTFSSKEFSYIDPVFDENAEFLFSYPEGESDSVDITTYERARLAPGVWLNDNLIDFNLKFIFSHLDEETKSKVHIFNSFFYRRLSSAPVPKTVGGESDKKKPTGYDLVRSWTRNSNLFEKEFIVVPICENLHWFLAIICYPKNILSTYEVIVDLNSDDEKNPIANNFEEQTRTKILVFDSLGLNVGIKLNIIKQRLTSYLIHEAHDKGHGEAFAESCDATAVVVPRQNNFSDCGCFLLEYVERFLKDSPASVFQDIMDKTGQPGGYSGWFAPSDAISRRERLIKLIDSLAEDYRMRAMSRPKAVLEDRSSDIEEIIS